VSLGALLFFSAGVRDCARETLFPYANARLWFNRTVGVRVHALFSRARYAVRVGALERDIARLQLAAADADSVEAENARLRALLNFKPPTPGQWVAAPVISRGGTTAVWQSLRLGKGSGQGIAKGAAVVVPEGVVGRVTDVSEHTCEVMLITDPNSRVACELDAACEDLGLIRGILFGGGAHPAADPELTLLYVVDPLRLRYLGREFNPSPRTRVVTSGLGQTFPKGLTVGYLLESQVEPNGLSREASVLPAVDMATLDTVFVLSAREGGARAP
jgi:rod shape-determining protein MreC